MLIVPPSSQVISAPFTVKVAFPDTFIVKSSSSMLDKSVRAVVADVLVVRDELVLIVSRVLDGLDDWDEAWWMTGFARPLLLL